MRSPLETQPKQLSSNGISSCATQTSSSIHAILVDTPGLGKVFTETDTTKDVALKCRNSDVLVYCLDMRQRLSRDDVNAITQLTEELSPELWKKAIFALTFANYVNPPPGSDDTQHTILTQTLLSWKSTIIRVLIETLKVPENIANDIDAVPTGYGQNPPSDQNDWFTPFWRAVFHKSTKFPKLESKKIKIQPPLGQQSGEKSSWAKFTAFLKKNVKK